MPDSPFPPAFGIILDGERLERLQRRLMRLAARQPDMEGKPHLQEMWVAVACAAMAGFSHMQVHCDGRGPQGDCPQCRTIHQAQHLGMDMGTMARRETDEVARMKREGRMN